VGWVSLGGGTTNKNTEVYLFFLLIKNGDVGFFSPNGNYISSLTTIVQPRTENSFITRKIVQFFLSRIKCSFSYTEFSLATGNKPDHESSTFCVPAGQTSNGLFSTFLLFVQYSFTPTLWGHTAIEFL